MLTLHKDALEFLLNIFDGRSPSGHSGSAPCPVPCFSLLISSSGDAEVRLCSPGLAGGMWVSAGMGWRSVPEGCGPGAGQGFLALLALMVSVTG